MKMQRTWAMPNCNTFEIPAIADFVRRYLQDSRVSVDPFARDNQWATHTNDLNPDTAARHHMDAREFCEMLARDGVVADRVIFDPPYSTRQLTECYSGVGRAATAQDTQSKSWSDWKTAIAGICAPNAIVLSFGWNSAGMGKKHGFELIEILLVAHGGMHNDTICLAERKMKPEATLF